MNGIRLLLEGDHIFLVPGQSSAPPRICIKTVYAEIGSVDADESDKDSEKGD